jgi:transcriptional regulator with XRE-family HTH domain
MKNIYSDIKNLNSRIKSARKRLGLTQTKIAKSLGIKQGHWSDIERGVKQPSETLLIAFIYRYAILSHWLQTGEGEMFDSKVHAISEEMAVYELPKGLQKLIVHVREIYNEGTLEEKIKALGPIDIVYNEMIHRKEAIRYDETKKEISVTESKVVRDKAG